MVHRIFGKGLAFRIFSYVIPGYCLMTFMAYLVGKFGPGSSESLVPSIVASLLAIGLLFQLNRSTVGQLRGYVQVLHANSAQLAHSTGSHAPRSSAQRMPGVTASSTMKRPRMLNCHGPASSVTTAMIVRPVPSNA